MKNTKILIVALILVLGSTAAWAQGKLEITPFVGYRTTGSINGGTASYTEFHIEDGLAYGVGLGYKFSPLFTLELQWSRVDSTVTAHGATFVKTELGSVATDVYHANFMFFFRPEEYKLRPYFMFGLGASVANVGTVTVGDSTFNPGAETRFSWNMGLGLEYKVGNGMGLRLQTRWLPTYINSTSGWWYDWWGNVWLVPIANYMNQFEFTGGLTFRF